MNVNSPLFGSLYIKNAMLAGRISRFTKLLDTCHWTAIGRLAAATTKLN